MCAGKWAAAVTEIKMYTKQGRPVLVGTTSVERSEALAAMLQQEGESQHQTPTLPSCVRWRHPKGQDVLHWQSPLEPMEAFCVLITSVLDQNVLLLIHCMRDRLHSQESACPGQSLIYFLSLQASRMNC